MTAYRIPSARWLATGGAVVLAGVLGIALLLQNGGSACAAVPSTSAKSGKATFYDLGGGTGNCSFPAAPADDLFVALGAADYAGAAACGSYLDVTGPKGKVRVKVIDSCPPCGAGHIDLSRTAFKKIANEVDGIVPVKYRAVPGAATPGPISVRVKEGSSQFWLAILIDNHANPLSSVKVAGKGGSVKSAHRESFNYWIIDSGAGSGPFSIKITDVYGRTASISGIRLSPGTVQKTSARMTGSSSGSVSAPKPATAKKKASPSASVSKPSRAPSRESAPLPSGPAAQSPEAVVPEAVVPDAGNPTEPDVALAAGAATGESCG